MFWWHVAESYGDVRPCCLAWAVSTFDFFQSSGDEVGRVGRRREREESGDGEASDLDYPGCRIENLIRFHSKPQIGFQHPKSAPLLSPNRSSLGILFFLGDFFGGTDRIGLS